jgi:anti-sigma factor RsiW
MSSDDFLLRGGRLDYINHRPIAAIVYRRDQSVINCFLWPEPGESQAANEFQGKGYNVIAWRHDNLRFHLISELASAELKLLQTRLMTPDPAREPSD